MIQTFIMPGPAASVIGRVSAVDRAAIAGVIGVTMCVCLAAALPSDRAVAVALVLLAIALALRLAIGTVVDLAATIGFIAGLLSGTHSTMSDARHIATDCLDGSDAIVAGRVIGLPDAHDQFVRFDFVPSRFESSARCELTVPRRARLVWYGGPDLRAGEVWALEVRWRALRNFRNPGAFDYVGWAVERSIDAGGSVRRGRQLTSEEADVTVMIEWDRLREGVVEWLGRATLDHSGLLAAVLVGDAREIDDETWEIFRRSGTVHLLVISGLHITLCQ